MRVRDSDSRNPPEPLVCATTVNDGWCLKSNVQPASELSAAVGNALDSVDNPKTKITEEKEVKIGRDDHIRGYRRGLQGQAGNRRQTGTHRPNCTS